MQRALLGLAAMSAAFVVSSPASAESQGNPGSRSNRPVTSLTPNVPGNFDRHGDRHRHDIVASDGFAYSGYNDYGDYDANRSFDSEKWNDWWHESPRAFPRWMSHNENCQRLWWSGGGWRC